MKWLQILSQVLNQFSVQQKQLQAAPEKLKGMTVQAGVYFVGVVFLVAFTLASVVMIFVNLGQQWDSEIPTHFTGAISAAILLFGLGIVAFGASALLARKLAQQNARRKTDADAALAAASPISPELSPLLIFGEEFIRQLLTQLANHPKDKEN